MSHKKWVTLASDMLSEYADFLEDRSCNDWDWPKAWTDEEKREFVKAFHEWNGDPEEYDPESLFLPDFAVTAFLSSWLDKQ